MTTTMPPNIDPTTTTTNTATDAPILDKALHIKYWTRCLKSLLPTQYQSNDSSRLLLAFLNLAALDILGVGVSTFPVAQREDLKSWILNCQHPNGGFCGSPNHKFPVKYYKGGRNVDPANLASTFFGILCLGFVGGLEEVNRQGTLAWLRTVQREDGSFGELCTADGRIAGGRDARYCHFAAGIRRILRGDLLAGRDEKFEDIDVEGLARYISSNTTYDGGMGETSGHEAHAGYTYCGIAALSFLGKLSNRQGAVTGLQDTPAILKWLMSRQVLYRPPPTDQVSDEEDGHSFGDILPLRHSSLDESTDVGCNGRCNKKADTCYVFWVGAALQMIGHGDIIEGEGLRRFLLNRTQYRIGGFGKCPGYPPDMYHSYLGLAALSVLGESSIKPIDPVYCVSTDVVESIAASILAVDSASCTGYIKNGLLWPSILKC